MLPDIGGILDIPALRPVMQAMNGDGEETRIVGGAVRNFLMSRPIADIDLATTALPEQAEKRARAEGWKVVPTGIEHGTVTVVIDGTSVEITTLREDIETDGRHAVVRFGRDFEVDARRRDFTINALSVDLDGRLYDYCDGLPDIVARRIRFIGDPYRRIREDYLRIMRFFRFAAVYGGGALEEAGLVAAIDESRGLDKISVERIRVELLKLLDGERMADVLPVMADAGILTRILAGVCDLSRLSRLPARSAAIEKLAAFAVMVQEDAGRLRERLRLSNEEHRFLHDFAALLEKVKGFGKPFNPVDICRLVADWPVPCILRVFQATAGEPPIRMETDAFALLQRFSDGREPVPVFPLRGADFVTRGVPKGTEIGRLMAEARALWLADGCPTGKDEAQSLLGRVLG